MSTYAKTTEVSPERTRLQIEAALKRYGAEQFAYGWDDVRHMATIMFCIHGRAVRFVINLPRRGAPPNPRDVAAQRSARRSTKPDAVFEQATRQRWRALLLYVTASLEAVENEVMTLDQVFLAGVVLPNNQTISEWAGPQLERFLIEERMPPLLPGMEAPEL